MRHLGVVVLATFTWALAVQPSAAQDERWGVAVTGGFVAGSVSGDDIADSDTRTGALAGASFTYWFAQNWGLEFGANYISKGGKAVKLASGGESFDLRSTYVEVPVLINLGLPIGDRWAVAAHAGLSAGFNLTCNEQPQGGVRDPVDCGGASPQSLMGPAKSVELSLPVGAGIGFSTEPNLGGTYLILGVRYYAGLTDAYEVRSGGGTSLKARNRAFAPFFRANFPLG